MRTIIVAAVFLTTAFPLLAVEADKFAQTRKVYEEASAKIEKKYRKKKDTEKGAKKYGRLMAPVICAYLAAIEAELFAQHLRLDQKDKDLIKELKEERTEMEAALKKFADNEILVLRWPGGFEWLPPGKNDNGFLIYSEAFTAKEFAAKAFLEFMNLKRRRGSTRFGSITVRAYFTETNKKLNLALGEGQHLVQWFYFRCEEGKKKAKIEISLSAEDEIVNVYVNLQPQGPKKKVKVKLRKGVNVLIVHVLNKKGMDIGLSVKAKGKGYKIGKPGRF